jgi:ABC-type transport system involved in cytochrome c biogenesis permease subunit
MEAGQRFHQASEVIQVVDMIERLTVLCFAGTYGVALASDLARFVYRGPARWYLTVALTALGWAVHTTYLANLAWHGHELPVTTVFESLLVLAWILAAIDLYLLVRSSRTAAVGVFVLPVVLAVLVLAGQVPRGRSWEGWSGWLTFWGTVHGVFLLLGAVGTCVAFAFGLMYLLQANRLKHKRPPLFGFSLPSLEQSERWNRGAISVAFPLLTAGIVIGLVLIVATHRSGGSALSWSDPKVVSTGALWLVFALLLHARYRPAMRGKSVMVLTIVAFAFLAFALVGVGLILPTEHGAPRATAGRGL